jgi:hypothetical protein
MFSSLFMHCELAEHGAFAVQWQIKSSAVSGFIVPRSLFPAPRDLEARYSFSNIYVNGSTVLGRGGISSLILDPLESGP